jgi:hypothetical protein
MAGVPGNLVNVTDGGSLLKQMSPVERVSPLSSNRGRTPRTWVESSTHMDVGITF